MSDYVGLVGTLMSHSHTFAQLFSAHIRITPTSGSAGWPAAPGRSSFGPAAYLLRSPFCALAVQQLSCRGVLWAYRRRSIAVIAFNWLGVLMSRCLVRWPCHASSPRAFIKSFTFSVFEPPPYSRIASEKMKTEQSKIVKCKSGAHE